MVRHAQAEAGDHGRLIAFVVIGFRISVLDFFDKYDEQAFRTIEQSLLHETIQHDRVVISTGGGTPCFFDNMEFIRHSGISLYLNWEVPALVRRLKTVRRKRPLLKDIPPAALEKKVIEQLIQREFYYNQADIVVRGENVDVDNLVLRIRSLSQAINP